jgi:hypothetical protein
MKFTWVRLIHHCYSLYILCNAGRKEIGIMGYVYTRTPSSYSYGGNSNWSSMGNLWCIQSFCRPVSFYFLILYVILLYQWNLNIFHITISLIIINVSFLNSPLVKYTIFLLKHDLKIKGWRKTSVTCGGSNQVVNYNYFQFVSFITVFSSYFLYSMILYISK